MTYVSLFVLKHVCPECLGTMAPMPLDASALGAPPCMCNRCGAVRTEEEFMERVEEHFADHSDDEI